jgi:hypothetical protein
MDFDRFPARGLEERRTFRRPELQGRASLRQALTPALLRHLQQAWRSEVKRPAMDRCVGGEIAREPEDILPREVDQQSFGHDQSTLRRAAQAGEQLAAGRAVRQVEPDALKSAHRRLTAEHFLLLHEDVRKVHFHPAQRRRQPQTIGARVEPCRQVHHRVATLLDAGEDGAVEEMRTQRPGPFSRAGKLPGDLRAALAGELAGKGVVEQRVGPLGLDGAVRGDPARCVGDVADERFVVHGCLLAAPPAVEQAATGQAAAC